MTSVNTNIAAMTALRNLQATNSAMEVTQNRISTGFKINEAKDNAAYWAIATTLKADNKSLATVKDALGLGSSTVDTAYQGLTKAKDVLSELRSKLSVASQDGLDRNKIQGEIAELQKQLKAIAGSSVFSGENWLQVDTGSTAYKADKSIVSSFSRTQSGAITIGTINVDTTGMALFDSNANGTGAILDSKSSLKTSAGADLTVGGFAAGATPSTTALSVGTATVSGMSPGAGGVAKITLGTVNLATIKPSDKIVFSLAVNGVSNQVKIDTTPLVGKTDPTEFKDALQTAINTAFGYANTAAAKAVVSIDANNVLTVSTKDSGTGATIAASNLALINGDGGEVTKTGNLFNAASIPAPASGSGKVAGALLNNTGAFAVPTDTDGSAGIATLTLGTGYAENTTTGTPVTNPAFSVDVTYKGKTKTISLTAAQTDTASHFADALKTALNTQFAEFDGSTAAKSFSDGSKYNADDLTATVGTGTAGAKITTAKKGDRETLSFSNFSSSNTGGLTKSTTTSATGTGTAGGVFVGDTISFDVMYGNQVKTASYTLTKNDVDGFTTHSDNKGTPTAKEFATIMQKAVDAAYGWTAAADRKLLVKENSTVLGQGTGKLTIESVDTGTSQVAGIDNLKMTLYGKESTARLGLDSKSRALEWNSTSSAFAAKGSADAVSGAGTASAPVMTLGTFNNAGMVNGDTIKMDVNLITGGVDNIQTIEIYTQGLTGTSGTDQAKFKESVQNAVNAKFNGAVTFDIDSAGKMTLTGKDAGDQYKLTVANFRTTKGDNVTTESGGLVIPNAGLSAAGSGSSTTTTQAVLSGTAFDATNPVALGSGKITFKLAVDGGTPTLVTIDKNVVNTALTTGGRTVTDGTIRSAADYATVLNSALTSANLNTKVTAAADGNTIKFTRTTGGSGFSLAMSDLTSTAGATTMSVDKIDISDRTMTTLGVTGSNMRDVLTAYIDVVNSALNKVITAADSLGSIGSRVDMQKSFVNTLMDTIDKGVSNLVDADMSEESTRLQALQTKQQLGIQALSIANQSAQSILSLFRG